MHGCDFEPVCVRGEFSREPSPSEAPQELTMTRRLALVEDPRLVQKLEDLDRELVGRSPDPESLAAQLPIVDRLAIPQPHGRWRLVAQGGPGGYLIPGALSDANLGELDGGLATESFDPPPSEPARFTRP